MIRKQRNSGIELLKIFSMFLIVIGHTTQTLYTENSFFFGEYVLKIDYTKININHLILNYFFIFGPLGNLIFLISSIWFFFGK